MCTQTYMYISTDMPQLIAGEESDASVDDGGSARVQCQCNMCDDWSSHLYIFLLHNISYTHDIYIHRERYCVYVHTYIVHMYYELYMISIYIYIYILYIYILYIIYIYTLLYIYICIYHVYI